MAVQRIANCAAAHGHMSGPITGRAIVAGKRVRILFVAMDQGSDAGELSFTKTQENFRMGAESRGNPHMGGVALIMAGLLDQVIPEESSRQFALTNAVKCGEQGKKNMNANRDPTMIRNCAHHLWSEMELLQPDLVITQGCHPRDTVLKRFADLRPVAEFVDGVRKSLVLRRDEFLVVTTPHPARLKGLKWKRGGLGLGRGSLPGFLEAALVRTREMLSSQ